jgi:NAD(P)-dependent dehydrogenase (short-subunit alcohol dehydrogenase family)
MSAPAKFSIDPTELADRRALVTGGSEGVGAAIVSRLAAGARVATTPFRPTRHRRADLYVRADVSTSTASNWLTRPK